MRFMLMLLTLLAACAMGPASVRQQGVRHALEQVLSNSEREGFSGAVLVVRRGHVLIERGIGELGGERLRANSRFWIASAGKQFTSAAIMRCIEQGLFSLDTPLSQVLPDAPSDKAAVTIRQLLSYSSGFPATDAGETASSAAEAVREILALPMEAAPGERFIYSNANYILAAAIVELQSGMPFTTFLQEQVLRRAGLSDTGQAVGPDDPNVSPIQSELPERLRHPRWSALSYYSTVVDLNRWIEALHTGSVLSRESANALFTPVARIQEGHSALGWFVGASPAGARRIFTRGNEDMGANSSIYYYPDADVLIVVLTHAGDFSDDLSWSREVHRRLEAALGI